MTDAYTDPAKAARWAVALLRVYRDTLDHPEPRWVELHDAAIALEGHIPALQAMSDTEERPDVPGDKDDGGPAYPTPVASEYGCMFVQGPNGEAVPVFYEGPSLRDYFIAHSPAEPQPWFDPVMDRPRPDGTVGTKGRDEWDKERSKQRYIQWPAAWADAQLAARTPAARTPAASPAEKGQD